MMDDSDYHFDFFQDEGKFSGNARWKRRRCALVFFSTSRTSEKLLALWFVYMAFLFDIVSQHCNTLVYISTLRAFKQTSLLVSSSYCFFDLFML